MRNQNKEAERKKSSRACSK